MKLFFKAVSTFSGGRLGQPTCPMQFTKGNPNTTLIKNILHEKKNFKKQWKPLGMYTSSTYIPTLGYSTLI